MQGGRLAVALALAAGVSGGCAAGSRGAVDEPVPSPVEPEVEAPAPGEFHPFYAKKLLAEGLPVISSARVPDEALRAAAETVTGMLARRPDLLEALVRAKVRVAIMASSEVTTDVPEHSDLVPKEYWDRRARGLGATPARPVVSGAEENLLGLPGDRYRGEDTLVHEFAHTVHGIALDALDPGFAARLDAAYREAKGKGLFADTYAISNAAEYWAEGVQSWFDANQETPSRMPDGIHNHVNTRAELEAYDPVLAALVAGVFRDTPWRWRRP
jgi:hypothetical protein